MGTGTFDNDWALDWVAELSEIGDADFPASTLRPFDDVGSVDGWECARALAAAEAVAASSGQPAADLPDGVPMWLEGTQARAGAQQVQLALRVVGTILALSSGLRRHAPLYVWGDEVGTWPDHVVERTMCPVYREYHWDDLADTGTSVDLVGRWLASDGDDEVVWAELDCAYDALTRRFEAFMLAKRAVVVAALEERGRPDDAVTLAGWDLTKVEAWLVAAEKKRITAKHDRLDTMVKRFQHCAAETNAWSARAQDLH